jgi:hypothetical protein
MCKPNEDSQKHGEYTKTSFPPKKINLTKEGLRSLAYKQSEEGIKILEVLCTVREEGKMGVFTAPWRQK